MVYFNFLVFIGVGVSLGLLMLVSIYGFLISIAPNKTKKEEIYSLAIKVIVALASIFLVYMNIEKTPLGSVLIALVVINILLLIKDIYFKYKQITEKNA